MSDDDATRARGGREVRARTAGSGSGSDRVDEPSAAVDPSGTASPPEPGTRRRRAVTIAIGVAAAVAVVAVVAAAGAAIALGGTFGAQTADAEGPPDPAEDALVSATVPTPDVAPGRPAGDGRVVFAVRHDDSEEDDRYRWRNADGSGRTGVAEGPRIVVEGVPAGRRVCIEVQVQRGSRTSEPVTECTA